MNKYQKLTADTLIFAIGTLSSKLLVFFMIPFYTKVMSQGQYGTADLLLQICNFIIPAASLSITQAVIRFGVEAKRDKRSIFTGAMLVILLGFAGVAGLLPLVRRSPLLAPYLGLLLPLVLVSALRALCAAFVRANEQIRLYALDALLWVCVSIAANLYLLGQRNLGVEGFLGAILAADSFSVLFLSLGARLPSYLRLRSVEKGLLWEMLRYSLPLVPTMMCLWCMDMSSRFFINHFWGPTLNGLYAIAWKVPAMVLILTTVFMDAWQISAFRDAPIQEQQRFFSNILGVYSALLFTGASILTALVHPITALLIAPSFQGAWVYMPGLIVMTVFSGLAGFMTSLFQAKKKSGWIFYTALASALLCLLLNFWLIPRIGAAGAVLSSALSYGGLFVFRAALLQTILPLNLHRQRLFCSCLLLVSQGALLFFERPLPLLQTLFVLAFLVLYRRLLWQSVRKLLRPNGGSVV